MIIVIDTREKLSFDFQSIGSRTREPFTTLRVTLPTGDYAIGDCPNEPNDKVIIVERKTLADLYGSVTRNRKRFEAEFERLAGYGYPALVIESDWEAICRPEEHLTHVPRVKPRSVVATLLAWSIRYGVHVFTCPSRNFAEQLTFRLLERWYLDWKKGKTPNGRN